MTRIQVIWDALPRWLHVAVWIALASVVSAAINAQQSGDWSVPLEWVPFVNILLVAVKDLLNTLARVPKDKAKVPGGNP